MVVTFKDLYLGNGTAYYEVIAKRKMDEIYDEYDSYHCIPPENMYFITVNELDILTDILKNKALTLTEIIEFAKNNDKDRATQKLEFQQHLHAMDINPQTSDYLAFEKDKMFKRILDAAKTK